MCIEKFIIKYYSIIILEIDDLVIAYNLINWLATVKSDNTKYSTAIML